MEIIIKQQMDTDAFDLQGMKKSFFMFWDFFILYL